MSMHSAIVEYSNSINWVGLLQIETHKNWLRAAKGLEDLPWTSLLRDPPEALIH